METSLEVGGSRFTSMEIPRKLVQVDLLPWKLVKASMEVRGIFYCRWKWKLPLLPSLAASTNIFRGSFHELPYIPTYFHLLPSWFHKTSIRVHRGRFHQLPWKSIYFHGSFHGSRWKWIYIHGNIHGIWWK